MRSRVWIAAIVALCALATAAFAQRRFFYGWDESVKNIPYDGRFTFVRIRYTPTPEGYLGGRPAVVGARVSARRAEPDAHHEGHLLSRCPHRRHQRGHARRSGVIQVSDRVSDRGRLLDDEREGSGRSSQFPSARADFSSSTTSRRKGGAALSAAAGSRSRPTFSACCRVRVSST